MRKLAFRYRRVREIYDKYKTNVGGECSPAPVSERSSCGGFSHYLETVSAFRCPQCCYLLQKRQLNCGLPLSVLDLPTQLGKPVVLAFQAF